MRRLYVFALFMALLFGAAKARGFFIMHPWNDLSYPEMYVPASDGQRPCPGKIPQTVYYTIDLKGSILVPGSGEAIVRAFEHWNEVDGATASFEFKEYKLYPESPEWTRWPDGDSAVVWMTQGWPFGSDILALTYIMTDEATGEIQEADVYLNAQYYGWGVLEDFREYPGSEVADVENIMTHEAGHVLGLGHSQVSEATMSGSIGFGQTRRRTLHSDDKDALRYQYPRTEADYPAPSLWGIRNGACVFDEYLFNPYIQLDEGAGSADICLFAAGIYSDQVEATLALDDEQILPDPVTGDSFVSENFVSAALDYTGLATAAYEPCLENPNGKTGCKFQGVFINQAGNHMPTAVAKADKEVMLPYETLTLDGTSSYDTDMDDLTFEWILAEAPDNAQPEITDAFSQTASAVPDEPGVYIFYLVVNDGIIDGVADQVSVTVIPEDDDDDDDDDDHDNAFGCLSMNPSHPGARAHEIPLNVFMLLAPLFMTALIRLGSKLGFKIKTSRRS